MVNNFVAKSTGLDLAHGSNFTSSNNQSCQQSYCTFSTSLLPKSDPKSDPNKTGNCLNPLISGPFLTPRSILGVSNSNRNISQDLRGDPYSIDPVHVSPWNQSTINRSNRVNLFFSK